MGQFADAIAGFRDLALDRQERIYRRAVELLAVEMNRTSFNGGALPHLTGNLMRSFLASKDAMISRGASGDTYAGQDVGIVIAGAALEDAIYLGWQATYARRMNSGFVGQDSLGRNYNHAGRHFVERAVAMWPALVSQAVREIRGR
jgi:hypothetical protein